MRIDELSGRRVVLLGLGGDVTASIQAIRDAGPAEVLVVESRIGAHESSGLDVVSLDAAAQVGEVFVRSPGFPRYQDLLQAALRRGAAMTTPVDLWMGTVGPGRTVVGVTGTKGKSTVTELVKTLALGAGLRVGLTGNLGPPVFGTTWDHTAPMVVVEVSSYQAADLHHVPDIAVIPYLAQDHLSWHGGLERYVADKLRLLHNEGGTAGRILIGANAGRAAEEIERLGLSTEIEVISAPDAGPLVPAHRVQNAALAAAVVTMLGGPVIAGEEIVDVAGSSLPGRLDVCPGPDGLLCVDDALASNPSATAAGLAWLRGIGRPTVLLLGGADRGVDVAPLVEEASRWPSGLLRVVALPETGGRLAEVCGLQVVAVVPSVNEGVRVALAASEPNGAILFSPAAPTPPGVGTWETRSSQFRESMRVDGLNA